jgi:hypothetical protein
MIAGHRSIIDVLPLRVQWLSLGIWGLSEDYRWVSDDYRRHMRIIDEYPVIIAGYKDYLRMTTGRPVIIAGYMKIIDGLPLRVQWLSMSVRGLSMSGRRLSLGIW